MWKQKTIQLSARPRGVHLITEELSRALPWLREVQTGILHLFLQHTSAALTINENADPDVRSDLSKSLDRIAPESWPFEHTCEGPDDMPAHIKSSLLGCQLTVPVSQGRMILGTWQGIYLCEFRNHATPRSIVATVQGESA